MRGGRTARLPSPPCPCALDRLQPALLPSLQRPAPPCSHLIARRRLSSRTTSTTGCSWRSAASGSAPWAKWATGPTRWVDSLTSALRGVACGHGWREMLRLPCAACSLLLASRSPVTVCCAHARAQYLLPPPPRNGSAADALVAGASTDALRALLYDYVLVGAYKSVRSWGGWRSASLWCLAWSQHLPRSQHLPSPHFPGVCSEAGRRRVKMPNV